jgi:regulator of ribonuclease activity A
MQNCVFGFRRPGIDQRGHHKALGSNPRKSEKKGIGTCDTPVKIGNLRIKPGDWVYCDADGILVAGRELPVA